MPQPAPAGAQPGQFTDPYRAYNFKVEIQGVTEGHFTQCQGLEVDVQVIQYREAGTSQIVHQIPGRVDYAGITLKYGVTNSKDLWDWLMTAVRGKVERRNVSVVMLGPDGVDPVLRWDLINAWPSRWKGVGFDALSQEMAIESLTLVFESLDRG